MQTGGVPSLLQALSECESPEPQLIVEAASPCKILLANPAWCQLTGYSSEDVVGNSVSLLCRRVSQGAGAVLPGGPRLDAQAACAPERGSLKAEATL